MKISAETAYALQNKFKGSGTTGGQFWGHLAHVKTRDLEGMLMISGTQGDETCQATLHLGFSSIIVTPEIADRLLSATECPICDLEDGDHKMDCPNRRPLEAVFIGDIYKHIASPGRRGLKVLDTTSKIGKVQCVSCTLEGNYPGTKRWIKLSNLTDTKLYTKVRSTEQ